MAVEVATWNMQQRLGESEHSVKAVEHIKKIGADVLVLTDAFWLGAPTPGDMDVVDEARETLRQEGYASRLVAYGNLPGHFPGRYMVSLSRLDGDFDMFKAGLSNVATLNVSEPRSRSRLGVAGAHFDDLSEANRVEQAEQVAALALFYNNPMVVMGDLNNLHRDSARARLLRATGPVTNRVPNLPPRNDYEREHGRPHHLKRLGQMARGEALGILTDAGFRDADPDSRPTFMVKGRPVVQLDHILVNSMVEVQGRPKVHEASVSDHLPISAKVEF